MENIIIAALLVCIVGAILIYIRKSKKRGVKCIGCPNKNCNGKCNK